MYSPLDEVYCIGNSEYKSMKTLINSYRELESIKTSIIDDQTIHFWNLQLQFMELAPYNLLSIYSSLRFSPIYRENDLTSKMDQLVKLSLEVFSEDKHSKLMSERDCLATHLALNLSGLIDE